METRKADLLKMVEMKELQEFQDKRSMVMHASNIRGLLEDIYRIQCPNKSDYDDRKDLIGIFNVIARETLGSKGGNPPTVEVFGSFLMGMFSHKSDLDLSIRLSDTSVECQRKAKIKILRKLAKKLYSLQRKGIVRNVQPVLTAVVPVLKVTDCGTGIECDLSVDNNDGVSKSQIVFMVSAIDERFQQLCFLMKAWAKGYGINSSRDQTLNSLSLISLVALHLQKQDPPILPPFSDILKDGNDPVLVKKNISKFMNSRQKNGESLPKLLVTLFIRLSSVRTLWPKGLCASIYEGSWIFKTWNAKIGCISVEDFTDRSQNVARAVNSKGAIKIYDCIDTSLNQIQAFLDRQIELSELRTLLFGPDDHLEGKKGIMNPYSHTKPILQDAKPMKNTQVVDKLVSKERYTYGPCRGNAAPAPFAGPNDHLEGKTVIMNPYAHTRPILQDAKLMKNTQVVDGLESKERYAYGLSRGNAAPAPFAGPDDHLEGNKGITNSYPRTKPILQDARPLKNTRFMDGLESKERYTYGPCGGDAAPSSFSEDQGRKRPHKTFNEHSADHQRNKIPRTSKGQAATGPSLRYGGTWGHASPCPVTYCVQQNNPYQGQAATGPSFRYGGTWGHPSLHPVSYCVPQNNPYQGQAATGPSLRYSGTWGHASPRPVTYCVPQNDPISLAPSKLLDVGVPCYGPKTLCASAPTLGGLNHIQCFGAQHPYLGEQNTQNVPFHPIHRPGGATPFNNQNPW